MRVEMKRHDKYYVYILKCADDSYYTGYTRDLNKRIIEHQTGRGANYTKHRLPVRLVYCKVCTYYENALKAEKRLKHMMRARKETLIKIYQKNNPRCFAKQNKARGDHYHD